MLIFENCKLALQALWANKLRSLLTMLGIIIGIGSVIAIMTVSASLSHSITSSFQEMGASNVTVGVKQKESTTESNANGYQFGSAPMRSTMSDEDYISDDMLYELKKQYKNEIEAISLSESVGSATVQNGSDSANTSITGTNAAYFKSNRVTLLAGRYLTDKDSSQLKKVIMISDKAVENLFNSDTSAALCQPVTVNINGIYETYYVVGVYEYEENGNFSSSSSSDVTTNAYIPLKTAKEELHSADGYSQFTIVTSDQVNSVSEFANNVKTFFAPYYSNNDNFEISASTMESLTESMTDMINTVSVAIAFIAGISLLVGGIGVMNIMLVSITERTREIGTRKALGAKNSSIRLQFIVESVVLCLIGGILGIVTGWILGIIAASILGYQATAPIAAILIAVAFSMLIGVFFGFYPANKAAKMNPIDALRYE